MECEWPEFFHFIISHCDDTVSLSHSLTHSPPRWVLSALICEPESRSAGIVGNFFCLSLQFLLFAKANVRVEKGERENICVQLDTRSCALGERMKWNIHVWYNPWKKSFVINANVKRGTSGRKWDAHASEKPSTLRKISLWLVCGWMRISELPKTF